IFGLTYSLEMLDALATTQLRENELFLGLQLRWNKRGDRLANDFLGAVTEQPRSPCIPRSDHAVERLADDRIIGTIDDRRKPCPAVLSLTLLRDVAKDQHHPEQLAVRQANRGSTVVDSNLSTIACEQYRVIGQPDDGADLQYFLHRIVDGPSCVLVDNAKHRFERLISRLLARPAGQRCGDGVHEGDTSRLVRHDDRITDAGQC